MAEDIGEVITSILAAHGKQIQVFEYKAGEYLPLFTRYFLADKGYLLEGIIWQGEEAWSYIRVQKTITPCSFWEILAACVGIRLRETIYTQSNGKVVLNRITGQDCKELIYRAKDI